jgi:hypothetical protein
MEFNPTSVNVSEVLVIALAVAALMMFFKKRYQSNLPLLFYSAALVFNNMTDRGANPYLMYGGLALTLLLRFEFLGEGVAKLVGFMAIGTLAGVIVSMISEVLV